MEAVEAERRREEEEEGRLLGEEEVVVGLWVEEGLQSVRRGPGRWTGGGFRRFCAEGGNCGVSLLAKLSCLEL